MPMPICLRREKREPSDRPARERGLFGQQGSVLVAVIIAVTVAASLGAAIYSFVSTSGRTQIGSMNDTNAYYLAESGGYYTIKRLGGIDVSNSTARNTLVSELTAQPFVVSNAGQFQLQNFTYSSSGGFDQVKFSAKGTPADASVSRSISYIINLPSSGGTSIPFDGTGPTLNADNWNVGGNSTLDATNNKVTLNSGTAATQVSLDWANANSTLPNLLNVWNGANGFLTYEVQAKVKLDSWSFKDVAAGISFRLNTQGDTNVNNDSFYALSYLWCYNHTDLSSLCGSDSSKTFVVLWKQAANGTKTVIGKQLVSSISSSLVSFGKLVDWSTLVVRVQEQLNPVSGLRENMISAFVGDAVTNPKGTIHWDYTRYAPVKWQSAFTGTDCSGGQYSLVADSTFTTANFSTLPQDEVGVHAFGGATGQISDLAMRFNFDGGVSTTCVAGAPGTIKLSASTYSVSEGGGTATITATRTNGSAGAVSVSYATSNGTATAGSDYTATSGTLSWADGDTANKTFTIPITNDTAFESNETVNVAITSPTGGATLGTPNTAVLTITDNDGVRPLNAWPSMVLDSGSTTLSGTFATSAGTDRLTVCAVTSELGAANSSYSVAGTYGGKPFTTLRSTGGLGTRQHVWLGYVKEAAIATRANDTVSLTVSAGSPPSASNLSCASYQGVDQTYPVAGSRANFNSGSSTVSFGGTVAVSNGGYIFYVLAANGASSTPPSGYIEHFDQVLLLSGYSQSGGSKKINATGSENPTWYLNTSDRWGLAVGSLNPSAGTGNPGTIDFSAPTYSVNENGGTATITVSRSGGITGAVGISYATSNGTATAGSDYTATSGTLSWAAGDGADKTFTIPILDNGVWKGDQTVNLTISNPTGGAVLGAQSTAMLTIVEGDAAVAGTIQFSAATYSGNENGGSVTITASRTGGNNGAVGVSYATANGTATAGSDYTSKSGTLSWANGDTTNKTFTVSITDDFVYEGNETVNLALSNPTGGATLGSPSTAVLTIVDNDTPVPGSIKLSASTYSVSESGGTVTITAIRSAGSNGAVGVNYATTNGTATAGSDYTAASGTLSWADGDTANKTFTITIKNDKAYEVDETVTITLSNPTGGATLVSPSTATLTITDDDGVRVLDAWPSSALKAGSSPLSTTFATSAGADRLLVCAVSSELAATNSSYSVSGTYGGQNFTLLKSTSGSSFQQHVWLGYVKESSIAARSNDTVSLSVSAGASLVGSVLYCGSYQGVDQTNPIVDSRSKTNNSSTVSFGGTVNATAGGYIVYAQAANSGSTSPPSGYTEHYDQYQYTYSQSGASKKITSTGTENPSWSISGSSWALAVGSLNPVGAGAIQFSASTYSVAENAGTVTITATRTGGYGGAVDVSYATSNGTATAGSDYTATSGTLSWADGDTANKTFTIPVIDDTIWKGSRTVNLALTNPTGGATLGTPNTAGLTITDNEVQQPGTIQFSASTYSVNEQVGGSTATITVTRTGGADGAVSVGYATANGTATAGSGNDYTATSGTLSWANGDAAPKTFQVSIADDFIYEGNETVNLSLSNPTGGATLGGQSTAVLTIADNETPPPGTIKLSASTYSVTENGGTVTITATRTGGSYGAVGISYATANGTATAGSDYTAASGTLGWADGDTANKTFAITIKNDKAYEVDETVTLALTTPTGGATLGSPSTAVLTITDEDGVRVLDAWPSSALKSVSSSSSLSATFATSAGADRLLVCAVSSELGSSTSSYSVSGTYGGQNFSLLKSTGGSSSSEHVWLGYVPESGIAARTSDTVSLSISAGTSLSGSNLYCASYQGVDQTNPIVASRSKTGSSSTVSFGGTVNVTAGGYILYAQAANNGTTSPPSGYTEHYDQSQSGYVQSGASEKITITGTENPSWSLSGGSSYLWGLAVGSLNPVDPGNIQFSASTYSVVENAGTVTITATRTGGYGGAVDVDYATANGTATAGSDYTATSGTLSWANGDTANKTFTIPIADDAVWKGSRTVNLALTNPTGGATLGTPNTAVLTITDNEVQQPGTIQFSASTYSVAENGGPVTITATRTGGSDGPVGVNYATSNGTAVAGTDYTATSGTLSWATGDAASKTFPISITDDFIYTGSRTVNLTLSSPTGGATLGSQNTAVLTITDNEVNPPGTIALSAATYSVSEGGGTVTITASRTSGSGGAVSVSYATSNGTATAGSDYTAASGTLSWADGDTANKTFSVPITNDITYEPSETVNIAITNATGGATLGSPNTAVLTITDNDAVAVLNTWSPSALDSGASSSLSATFTTSAGSDRLLVCAVMAELGSSSSSYSVTGNYGGQGFTTLASTSGASTRQHVWLGYVKEAGIAAKSNSTVSMSISAGSSPTGADLYCASYQNVNQTTPIADSQSNFNASGSSTVSFGGNVTVVAGGYIFYAQAANGSSTTPPNNYAEHFDQALDSYSQSGGSMAITTSGTENPSWTIGASERWGLAVGSLNTR